ncbi:LysM peptidoglycan-binding domain-containing protein [Tepidibacter mesophilus]|uniref:LysM peptidoglycan-binding domain-containing protein n=1 Tax=Tepidibacter mesophilus TaxID=655607 RepID=UPI000C07090C|nr:LysM domain-containing protein [Tepidibacter mesophilus]
MLYYVRRFDTLQRISNRFNVPSEAIIKANVICDPNYITVNTPLIIPEPNISLPKSQGQPPYYIVQFRDTFLCLSKEFKTTVNNLIYMNRLNPNMIPTGYEILIGDYLQNPDELSKLWEDTGNSKCDELSPDQVYNIYYNGSFTWEALGRQSIPYLMRLINNPCDIVKYYSIVSLGRIGSNNNKVIGELTKFIDYENELISNAARWTLLRISLVRDHSKRMHVTTVENRIYDSPDLNSNSFTVPAGSQVMSLNWSIPSPTNEKNIFGETLLYDRVRFFTTGQDGYLPRLGFNEINVI